METNHYKGIVDAFQLNEQELFNFLINYYDATAFNKYLKENYCKYDFTKKDNFKPLKDYFQKNHIEEEQIKEIVISAPQILSCIDFEKQLRFIYKDKKIEGIMIIDERGVFHPYRLKNNMRSITENRYLLDDMIETNNNNYKKSYYYKTK